MAPRPTPGAGCAAIHRSRCGANLTPPIARCGAIGGGGRLSLAITTLFWGAAAVLQFAVLRWATDRLGLTLAGAAYLQAAVAVGLIAGAWLAGRHIGLQQAPKVCGRRAAARVCWWPSVRGSNRSRRPRVLLIAVGLVGGLLMVPMNALLQHRGCQLLSPGRSIAVQGFNENVSVLALLAAYAATVRLEVPIAPLMTAFGMAVAAAMALLAWTLRRSTRRAPALAAATAQVLKGRNNSGL